MTKSRDFDLVLFGATGFTGRLVAEYLLEAYGDDSGLRWAMAGRSEEKLGRIRDELGAPSELPLLVADSGDPVSLRSMAESTRLVMTTVGPYQTYGSELLGVCADTGTDYVDLCGEPAWMREMIDKHEDRAIETGARIVFSCGFDSIPFDMGVFFLQQEAKRDFGTTAPRVKGRVRKMKGGFSGGTAASLKATLAAAQNNPSVLALLRDPFALTPGFSGPAQPRGTKPVYDEDMELWLAPFIMAPINTRNVHRSNALLGHAYGEEFVYDEMLVVGRGKEGEKKAGELARSDSLGGPDGPKPGEGPSREEREAGCYDILFIGIMSDDRKIRVNVSGDLDPGYGSTSRMISESALCLLRDCEDTKGGIWTTAPAMGERLLRRLVDNAGLRFERES